MAREENANFLLGKPEVFRQHVDEFYGFLRGRTQTNVAWPGFGFELRTVADGARFRGDAFAAEAAFVAGPLVVYLVAGSGNVVGVYVEDEVGAEPAFLVHVGFGILVVSAGMVDVRGNGSIKQRLELFHARDASVPYHGSFPEKQKGEFSLADCRGSGNRRR